MKTKIKISNKFLSVMLCLALLLSCVPISFLTAFAEGGGAIMTVGDFTIAPTDGITALTENTDYTYADGKLTIKTTTPVTIGMKAGVAKTAEIIVTDSTNGEAAITFNSINIETTKDEAITVQGNSKTTLYFSGTNNIVSGDTGIDISNKTPLNITSLDEGHLNISGVKYGIACIAYSTTEKLEITGNINIDISECTMHAIYYREGAVSISGTPVINIDTVEYAIYGVGIAISGGTFTLKNDDGYIVCSSDAQPLELKGQTDMHILEGDRGLYAYDGGKVTITDSAKLKVYGGDASNKTAAITDCAITARGLLIEKNAFVDVFTKEDAINGGTTKIDNNAQVNIKIDCKSTYSQHAIRFDSSLDICGNAKVDITVINGSKVYGLYDITDGTVNISNQAVVTIEDAYRSVYADYLNLSGNASLSITDDLNYAIYGVTTIQDSAKLTATSAEKKVLYEEFTVKPAEGKTYMVKAGSSEAAATTEYYTEETTKSEKSSWRYFHAESIDMIPVSITVNDANTTVTYDGSEIDLTKLFKIDDNAGTATYSVVNGSGAGEPNGDKFKVTAAGTFTVTVNTAQNGGYAAGMQTATLTVNKGTVTLSADIPELIYDGVTKESDISNAETTATLNGTVVDDVVGYSYTFVNEYGDTLPASELTEAGKYKVTVTVMSNDPLYTGSGTFGFEIKKAGKTDVPNIAFGNESVFGKNDGSITGVDSTMEWREDGESDYTSIATGVTSLTDLVPGKYYIRYAADDNHNASADAVVIIEPGQKLTVTIPPVEQQIGYTLETDVNEIEYGGDVLISIALADGYEKTDAFAVKVNGEKVELTENNNVVIAGVTGDMKITVEGVARKTYTVTYVADGKTVSTVTVEHGKDAAAPKIPAKSGYTAAWDKDGKAITADTTITAVYTAISITDNPQTGDNSNMCLWFMLILVSGGTLVALTVYNRKKRITQR